MERYMKIAGCVWKGTGISLRLQTVASGIRAGIRKNTFYKFHWVWSSRVTTVYLIYVYRLCDIGCKLLHTASPHILLSKLLYMLINVAVVSLQNLTHHIKTFIQHLLFTDTYSCLFPLVTLSGRLCSVLPWVKSIRLILHACTLRLRLSPA